MDILDEVRRIVIKVNSKGKRRRKIVCGPGKKLVDGHTCRQQTGPERMKKRMAVRKMVRTLRRRGAGAKRRAQRLRARAMARRNAMGLHKK